MDVILLQRIERLGQMGDVVKVRPGYARNFLLPRKKALRATKENMARFEQQRSHLEAENLQRRDEAEQVGAKLNGISVVLVRQAGEGGQLYGSASARDLAEAITEAGFTVNRDQIRLDRPIKILGLHEIRVQLHPEVTVAVTANVARSAEAAEQQAKTGVAATEEERRLAEERAEAAAEAEREAALVEAEGEEGAGADGEESDTEKT
ncbi:MAG: 50S ribosomal protein L9 [Kiloniellales bacterium]